MNVTNFRISPPHYSIEIWTYCYHKQGTGLGFCNFPSVEKSSTERSEETIYTNNVLWRQILSTLFIVSAVFIVSWCLGCLSGVSILWVMKVKCQGWLWFLEHMLSVSLHCNLFNSMVQFLNQIKNLEDGEILFSFSLWLIISPVSLLSHTSVKELGNSRWIYDRGWTFSLYVTWAFPFSYFLSTWKVTNQLQQAPLICGFTF